MTDKEQIILDACCGSRMFHFDKNNKKVSNCIEIYDCIIVSKIVKDIIIKAKGEGNE